MSKMGTNASKTKKDISPQNSPEKFNNVEKVEDVAEVEESYTNFKESLEQKLCLEDEETFAAGRQDQDNCPGGQGDEDSLFSSSSEDVPEEEFEGDNESESEVSGVSEGLEPVSSSDVEFEDYEDLEEFGDEEEEVKIEVILPPQRMTMTAGGAEWPWPRNVTEEPNVMIVDPQAPRPWLRKPEKDLDPDGSILAATIAEGNAIRRKYNELAEKSNKSIAKTKSRGQIRRSGFSVNLKKTRSKSKPFTTATKELRALLAFEASRAAAAASASSKTLSSCLIQTPKKDKKSKKVTLKIKPVASTPLSRKRRGRIAKIKTKSSESLKALSQESNPLPEFLNLSLVVDLNNNNSCEKSSPSEATTPRPMHSKKKGQSRKLTLPNYANLLANSKIPPPPGFPPMPNASQQLNVNLNLNLGPGPQQQEVEKPEMIYGNVTGVHSYQAGGYNQWQGHQGQGQIQQQFTYQNQAQIRYQQPYQPFQAHTHQTHGHQGQIHNHTHNSQTLILFQGPGQAQNQIPQPQPQYFQQPLYQPPPPSRPLPYHPNHVAHGHGHGQLHGQPHRLVQFQRPTNAAIYLPQLQQQQPAPTRHHYWQDVLDGGRSGRRVLLRPYPQQSPQPPHPQ